MHARRRTAAVIAASALTAALLPLTAGAAQADPSGPSFSYVYVPSGVAPSNQTDRLFATTPGNPGTGGSTLSPISFVDDYDVSEDGNVLLVAGQSRNLRTHPLDTTYGLTLTVRNGSDITTKTLTNSFEGAPVLTRDGSLVFWYDGGILWKYVVATGETAASARFPAAVTATTEERLVRFAVSADGTKIAALFEKYDSQGREVSSRVRAATFSGTEAGYSEAVAFTASSVSPIADTLTWSIDGSSFFYSREKPDLSIETVQATLTTPKGGATVVTGWNDVFDVTVHLGTYYLFRYEQDGTGEYTLSQVGSTTSTARPTDWTFLGPGASAYHLQASTVAPPALTTPTNQAVPSVKLATSASVVKTNGLLRYGTWARYLNDVTGQVGAGAGLQTRYGRLLKSTDGGKTFTKLATTTGSGKLSSLPGGNVANGSTTALTRNTWLKWCFDGDLFVKAGCSTVKKITVTPVVTAAVQKKGTQKRVYGKAARVGGAASLQRLSGGVYKPVATATLSSTGAYSFGFRSLPTGKYRVVVKPDASWGTGLKSLSL